MNLSRLYNIILGTHLTEKTAKLGDNVYAFKVKKDASKTEIKEAVTKLFNVEVVNVNTINKRPKRVKFKNTNGVQSATKKAYVKLEEGFEIDFEKIGEKDKG